MLLPVSVSGISNFPRTIQSMKKSCFGSIVRGSLRCWIGSIINEPRRKLGEVFRVNYIGFGRVGRCLKGTLLGERGTALPQRRYADTFPPQPAASHNFPNPAATVCGPYHLRSP